MTIFISHFYLCKTDRKGTGTISDIIEKQNVISLNRSKDHYDVLIIDGEYLADKDLQNLYEAANVDVADEHVSLPEFRGMILDENVENYRAVEGKYKGINYYAIWIRSIEKVYYTFRQGAVTVSYCEVGKTSMPTHEEVEAQIDKQGKIKQSVSL